MYKYLWVVESNQMRCGKIKCNIARGYFHRVRKLFKSKLNGGNVIRAVNIWAMSLTRYAAVFIKWSCEELHCKKPQTENQKLSRLVECFHDLRNSIARLSLPRNTSSAGPDSSGVLQYVELTNLKVSLATCKYVTESIKRMLSATTHGHEIKR